LHDISSVARVSPKATRHSMEQTQSKFITKSLKVPASMEPFLAQELFLTQKLGSSVALEVLKKFDCFLAGGFPISLMYNSRYSDLDFFFTSLEEQEKAKAFMCEKLGVQPNLHNTSTTPYFSKSVFADSFRDGPTKIQLISVEYGSMEKVLNSFDFINCQIAVSYDKNLGECVITHNEEVENLFKNGKWKYQIQPFMEERLAAAPNLKTQVDSIISRMEKYIDRFPHGPVDNLSKENLIIQIAYLLNKSNAKYFPYKLYRWLESSYVTPSDLSIFISIPQVKTLLDRKIKEDKITLIACNEISHEI
jgi:hypothetical protein